MGIYSRYACPWIIDHVMARQVLVEQRRVVLSQASGRVLEIGFGTALNLPYYGSGVTHLAVLEPNPGMRKRARTRLDARGLEVDWVELREGRDLAVENAAFDCVVSTWVLCTVSDAAHAVAEVYRVLKPGGRFLFIEHGLSPDPRVAGWQSRLNGLQRRIGDGCNLNRDISAFVGGQPFCIEQEDRFYMPRTPRIVGYTYRGVARKQPRCNPRANPPVPIGDSLP